MWFAPPPRPEVDYYSTLMTFAPPPLSLHATAVSVFFFRTILKVNVGQTTTRPWALLVLPTRSRCTLSAPESHWQAPQTSRRQILTWRSNGMPLPFATCWSETNKGPCSAGETLSRAKITRALTTTVKMKSLRLPGWF